MISTTWRTDSTSSSAMLKIFPAAASGCSSARSSAAGDVLRVTVVVEGEAVVGDDDALAAVEHTPHHDPLPGRELVRAVHVRVTEVGGVGVRGEHRGFGTDDPVALLVVLRHLDGRRVLGDRDGQTGRFVQPRVHPTPVGRYSPHRDHPAGVAAQHVGDDAEAAVHRVGHVEAGTGERVEQRPFVERVGVEVLDHGRSLGPLVRAAVEDRDPVPAVDEPPDERDPRRPRPPDHQDVHPYPLPACAGPLRPRSVASRDTRLAVTPLTARGYRA